MATARRKQAESCEGYPDAPAHLSERAKGLWRAIGPNEARSLERRTLFQVALESLDRADQARAAVDGEGMTKTTSAGMIHVHPLLKVEKDARAQFARIWEALGLKSTGIDSGW